MNGKRWPLAARRGAALIAVALMALVAGPPAFGQSRLKDIARIGGVRDNGLVGTGVVAGLAGTGDSPAFPTTGQTLRGLLQRHGVASPERAIRSQAVAMVTVSASLPSFAKPGARIDVAIGVLGDATSLKGGVLQPTPLLGPDGQVYAVAQGPVSIGGFAAAGAAQSVINGVVATAHIAGGAVVERASGFDLNQQPTVTVSLLNPDFSLARQVARAINSRMKAGIAHMQDNTNIDVTVPSAYHGRTAEFVADIENLSIAPDQSPAAARVVIDDRTGTVVLGREVRLSTVAVSRGGLTVQVTEAPQVSQPPPFSPGRTVVVPRTNIQISEGHVSESGSGRLVMLPAGSTLGELVNSLNALHVGVRDQIAILEAIKNAGALQADLVVAH